MLIDFAQSNDVSPFLVAYGEINFADSVRELLIVAAL